MWQDAPVPKTRAMSAVRSGEADWVVRGTAGVSTLTGGA